MLEESGDAPVYGPNLQLAVELTESGRTLGAPLLAAEQERMLAEQRATDVVVLPLNRVKPAYESDTFGEDRPVRLCEHWRMTCRGDYVIRLNGTTCLQLWNAAGQVTRLEGDPLQVATWLKSCHDAGIDIRLQINESITPEQGSRKMTSGDFPGGQTSSTTETWYQELLRALRQYDIYGLSTTNRDHLKNLVNPVLSARFTKVR